MAHIMAAVRGILEFPFIYALYVLMQIRMDIGCNS
jgi:hypothetical protein